MSDETNGKSDEYRWAEERTGWAEDRTILANERTFAGWMRTGLACAALGLGFHALFPASEPSWLPKLGASFFIFVALAIYAIAFRTSSDLAKRVQAHAADPMPSAEFGWLTAMFVAGTLGLGILLWWL